MIDDKLQDAVDTEARFMALEVMVATILRRLGVSLDAIDETSSLLENRWMAEAGPSGEMGEQVKIALMSRLEEHLRLGFLDPDND
jgi:hypothetical protein